jgi:hypothetical protein
MKQTFKLSAAANSILLFVWLMPCLNASGQETSTPLPENISKIVSVSCMPCHSSTGGVLSRSKLNFSEWTEYSAEKQKKKAEKMYKELKKSAMPPKDARENNPDIIPTSEQLDIIKSWVDSFQNENK